MLFENYALKFPMDSLRAFYKMNGNANDASGNGNNGTIQGATLTTDRFNNTNKAYFFNDDTISVPDDNTLDIPSGGITLAGWINISAKQGSGHVHFICTKASVGALNNRSNYALDVVEQTAPSCAIRLLFVDASNNYKLFVSSSVTMNAGTWYYVMITHTFGTSSSIMVYLNNSSVGGGTWVLGTGNELPKINTEDLEIGNGPTSNYLVGKLDIVSIHSKVVTTEERTDMYNYPRSYP